MRFFSSSFRTREIKRRKKKKKLPSHHMTFAISSIFRFVKAQIIIRNTEIEINLTLFAIVRAHISFRFDLKRKQHTHTYTYKNVVEIAESQFDSYFFFLFWAWKLISNKNTMFRLFHSNSHFILCFAFSPCISPPTMSKNIENKSPNMKSKSETLNARRERN